jgi:hypothetical protein
VSSKKSGSRLHGRAVGTLLLQLSGHRHGDHERQRMWHAARRMPPSRQATQLNDEMSVLRRTLAVGLEADMSILRDLYRRAVIGSWQTPESTRSSGSDTARRTFRIRLGRGMNGRKHLGPVPLRTGNRLQGAQRYSR